MSIVIEDAVKKYGRGESEIYALNHVSFQIESGEVCVILGPSGSGIGILSKEAIKSLGAGMEYYSIRYGDKEKETAFRTEIYEKYGTVEYVEQKANTRISLIY